MEVGQANKKIGFIIQARMKSTRLPKKVLTPIPLGSGKPILEWIIESLKKSSFSNEVIVATSVDSTNDAIDFFCKKRSVSCFRGDEKDVLSRFVAITKANSFDAIVRWTADNPIVDMKALDTIINFHFANDNDYTFSTGLPIGMNFEVIKPNILMGLEKIKNLTDEDREHVTLFLKKSGLYKIATYEFALKLDLGKIRLTIDYPSDFMVVSTVLSILKSQDFFNFQTIAQIKEDFPWIFSVNQTNKQYVPVV